MTMFSAATANIFGIESGGQIFCIEQIVTPVSLYSGFLMVYLNFNHTSIINMGALLTFFNIVLLYFFDDKPMKSKAYLAK